MSERNALILLFAAMSVLVSAVLVGLKLLDARDEVFTLAILLLACLWADRASSVVMHYGRKRRAAERRRD
jgi:hypothetical protein